MPNNYYETLGVSKTATQDEIKKAFRKKAHELHPDKAGGDEAKFKEANEAYQILGNEDKRKQYDQYGSSAFSGQGFGGTGMNWEDFMRQAQSGGFAGGGFNVDFGDLGDIFSDVFGFGSARGGRGRRSRTRDGEDIEIELSVDFKDAVFGTEREIRLEHIGICEKCHGNGAEPGTRISECARCNGSGAITHTQRTMLGTFQTRSACPECGGEGKRPESPCKACRGEGRAHQKEDVRIKIPAGIDNGQRIRISGRGNAGRNGGGAGDLYVRVRVREDSRFVREGDDIITEERISIPQAVLGDSIEVQTVHGPVKLKVPSGTQSGKVFKLSGKGIPRLNRGGTGDHLVRIMVDIPSKLSRRQKKLFEELRDA